MSEQDGQYGVQPPRRVREGWDEAFAEMKEQGDDYRVDEIVTSIWDEDQCEW